MKILTDSREQLPYSFPGHEVEVSGLPVGDYSLKGAEHLVAVERKSIDDLIGSLTSGRSRFERELYRMKSLDYGALVIEASLSDIANGQYRSNMLPKSAVESLMAFSIRYKLPIFFAENRQYGQRITESLLCKYTAEIEKRFKVMGG